MLSVKCTYLATAQKKRRSNEACKNIMTNSATIQKKITLAHACKDKEYIYMKPNLEKNLDELISREANLTFSIFHCPLSFERRVLVRSKKKKKKKKRLVHMDEERVGRRRS
jgi:hypothetical protein